MSTIKVDTIKNTSNVEVFTAKAWVNFDGTTNTGGSCTIRASGNVTSVTDNGTGDYTINFTTAMTDANYSSLFTNGELNTSYWGPIPYIYSQATASVRVRSVFATGSFSDASSCNVIVFR